MPSIDLSGLGATIDALTAEATRTEGTEDSAGKVISGFSAAIIAAVTTALEEDKAANQASIDAATAAIQAVTDRFVAADDKLGAAIAANPPTV